MIFWQFGHALSKKDIATPACLSTQVDATCEIATECQSMLSVHKPEHRFRDLCERIHPETLQRLQQLQRTYINRLLKKSGMKTVNCKAFVQWRKGLQWVEKFSAEFLLEALELLRESEILETAFCHVHGRHCTWRPEIDASKEVWIEIAGLSCTPWSQRGARLGWLDEASLPALIWGVSLRVKPPSVVVTECVPSFPHYFLDRVFDLDEESDEDGEDDEHKGESQPRIHPYCFSPTDLGWPANRPRQYVLTFPKGGPDLPRLRFSSKFFPSSWMRTFARKLMLAGSVFMNATWQEKKSYMDFLAAQRYIPPRAAGKAWRCEHVLDIGDRLRLKDYQDKYGEADVNVDVHQRLGFGTGMEVLPTITRNVAFFNLKMQRLYLERELLLAQGIDVQAEAAELQEAWGRLPPKVQHSMIGNAMCVPQLGAILTLLLVSLCIPDQEGGT